MIRSDLAWGAVWPGSCVTGRALWKVVPGSGLTADPWVAGCRLSPVLHSAPPKKHRELGTLLSDSGKPAATCQLQPAPHLNVHFLMFPFSLVFLHTNFITFNLDIKLYYVLLNPFKLVLGRGGV